MPTTLRLSVPAEIPGRRAVAERNDDEPLVARVVERVLKTMTTNDAVRQEKDDERSLRALPTHIEIKLLIACPRNRSELRPERR